MYAVIKESYFKDLLGNLRLGKRVVKEFELEQDCVKYLHSLPDFACERYTLVRMIPQNLTQTIAWNIVDA